jgi:proton-translocating NAD(P)+ transhydrogenase subunit alpha
VSDAVTWLTIFVLAAFVGVEVISKVSSTLHTPLMSGANAIHGVVLVGAILVAGAADNPTVLVLSLVAVVLAAINMAGGFVVTDRMLLMFTPRRRPAAVPPAPPGPRILPAADAAPLSPPAEASRGAAAPEPSGAAGAVPPSTRPPSTRPPGTSATSTDGTAAPASSPDDPGAGSTGPEARG